MKADGEADIGKVFAVQKKTNYWTLKSVVSVWHISQNKLGTYLPNSSAKISQTTYTTGCIESVFNSN